MDWARFRYTTDCRFFHDSDETARIVWYPALPDAEVLPYESAIYHKSWDREGNVDPFYDGVGEVWDVPRVVNHMRPVPLADGSHLCGTREMFEQGASYNPSLPPIIYREDGLPECCPGEPLLGIVWGGESRPMPEGGIWWSGESPGVETGYSSCADANQFSNVPADGLVRVVRMTQSQIGGLQLWCRSLFLLSPSGEIRIRHIGGQPGTVTFYTHTPGQGICANQTLVGSGDSGASWEMVVTVGTQTALYARHVPGGTTPAESVLLGFIHEPP